MKPHAELKRVQFDSNHSWFYVISDIYVQATDITESLEGYGIRHLLRRVCPCHDLIHWSLI